MAEGKAEMKPNGLRMEMNNNSLTLNVTKPSQVEDAIWEAVKQAIWVGWTPEQFKREITEAWEYELKQEIESAFSL